MNAAVGTPTGSRSGSGTVGSKAETASYASAPTAPPVKRGMPVGRLDPAARDEGADGGQRVGRGRPSRSAGRANRSARSTGRVWIRAQAVADLEQPARPDAEERIATEPLAALDRFEQVGRAAVIEPEEGPDRRLEVGRARGAQEDRVGVGGEALRLRQADRIGCASSLGWPRENQNDHSSPGRKVVPSAVPPSFGDAALS